MEIIFKEILPDRFTTCTSDDMEDIRPRTWFRQREQLHGHGSQFHCQVPNSKIVHDFNSILIAT
jgi:hypothetical protein